VGRQRGRGEWAGRRSTQGCAPRYGGTRAYWWQGGGGWRGAATGLQLPGTACDEPGGGGVGWGGDGGEQLPGAASHGLGGGVCGGGVGGICLGRLPLLIGCDGGGAQWRAVCASNSCVSLLAGKGGGQGCCEGTLPEGWINPPPHVILHSTHMLVVCCCVAAWGV
jgi:hypothetical protein